MAGSAPVLSIRRHSRIEMSLPRLVTQPLTPDEKSACFLIKSRMQISALARASVYTFLDRTDSLTGSG